MPKKKAPKKVRKAKPLKRKPKAKAKPVDKPIGVVTHFYGDIKVGIFKFKKPVKVGLGVVIRGATTNFKTKISSMQFNHEPVKVAKKGKQIGVKLSKRVRVGDEVFEE